MDTASESSAQKRAPTVPRRRRVAPEQRKRVATACNSCSLRRIKCSGENPCIQCSRGSRSCIYPECVDKVTIPRTELDALQEKCASLEKRLAALSPDSAPTALPSVVPALGPASAPVGGFSSTTSSPSALRNQFKPRDIVPSSEGRLLHDPDGTARYFGESSGANFLNHIKEFMATIQPIVDGREASQPGRTFIQSVGSYQTYDSRPLELHPKADPLWLPSRTQMTVLLNEFRYFAQDGNGDFPSGGIFYWGIVPSTPPDPRHAEELRVTGQLAFIHIAFAIATRLGAAPEWSDERQSGIFFSRARLILGNPLDITSYSFREVSVLLLMSLFLVEMNRRDAAYVTVSMALHLCVMYGIHASYGVDEATRRVFWTLYVLDCWLASLLGRPPSIADTAIRLERPSETPGFPNPAGLRAHIDLAGISRYITCNIYRVAPWDQSPNTTVQHVEHALELLQGWLGNLPPELRLDYDNFTKDRACCVLHLSYNQAVILTTRPIFFVAVKKIVADRYLGTQTGVEDLQDNTHMPHIRLCIETARQNFALSQWIREISPRYRMLHHEAHAVFNAAVIILLTQLAFVDLDSRAEPDISVALAIFGQEASLGNNFGIDCVKVLRDLRSLVQALRERPQPILQPVLPGPLSLVNGVNGTNGINGVHDTNGVNGTHISNGVNGVNGQLDHNGMYMDHANGDMAGAPDMTLAMGDDSLQSQLQAWLDNDYLQLYNDYLM